MGNTSAVTKWRLRSGEQAIDRVNSHLHGGVLAIMGETLGRIESAGRDFIVETVDLGRVVGMKSRVRTAASDEIVYAQRIGRFGLSRFVKNRKAEPCSFVTVVLKRFEDRYVVISAWIGTGAEPEPWDRKATERSIAFWSCEALIWGTEEIVPGSETQRRPW